MPSALCLACQWNSSFDPRLFAAEWPFIHDLEPQPACSVLILQNELGFDCSTWSDLVPSISRMKLALALALLSLRPHCRTTPLNLQHLYTPPHQSMHQTRRHKFAVHLEHLSVWSRSPFICKFVAIKSAPLIYVYLSRKQYHLGACA